MHDVPEREINLEELTLETESRFLDTLPDNSLLLEGVTTEEEMNWIREHCCGGDGLPFFLEVDGEFIQLGLFELTLKNALSIVAGGNYKLTLRLDGNLLDLTEPDNLIRLIQI